MGLYKHFLFLKSSINFCCSFSKLSNIKGIFDFGFLKTVLETVFENVPNVILVLSEFGVICVNLVFSLRIQEMGIKHI